MKRVFKRLMGALLAVVTVMSCFTFYVAHAEDYSNGGYALSTRTQSVRSANSASASVIGTIYAYEGMTVLTQLGSNMYIEYSTPSGPKRGYLINAQMDWRWIDHSRVGRVNSSTNVRYGPSSSAYDVAGSISSGEYVAVLGMGNGWAYVEYNASVGRKRGYIPTSVLTTYGSHSLYGLYSCEGDLHASANVLSGPGDGYPTIGSVSNENVKYGPMISLYDNIIYIYIEYYIDGTNLKKSGFIKAYD